MTHFKEKLFKSNQPVATISSMKKIIISLALLLIIVKPFCQTPVLSKDYYLQKSQNQKTVAWVMLGGGVAIATVGLVIVNKHVNDDPIEALSNLGTAGGSAILTIAGIGTALGSIPFFISSAKNKRRAFSIAISNQKIYVPQQKGYALNRQPALKFKLKL